jgi:hypothetical protein
MSDQLENVSKTDNENASKEFLNGMLSAIKIMETIAKNESPTFFAGLKGMKFALEVLINELYPENTDPTGKT